MIVVLMGVSGAGKTTIGSLLAGRKGVTFADADDFHSAANKAKMASGQALNDADRAPWLVTLNGLLRNWSSEGVGGVLACSALKQVYRETLAANLPEGAVQFVVLDGSRELIAERLEHREGHYMKAGLLDTQLATLEPPRDAIRVINDRAPNDVVTEILEKVKWL